MSKDPYLVSALTKACKIRNDKVRIRFPIQKRCLQLIINQVDMIYDKQPFLAKLYMALFTTAYYGMFRVGELTTGDHPILTRNVNIASNKEKVLFYLETSKTHGKSSKPQTVTISGAGVGKVQKNNKFCPFYILRNYLQVRGGYKSVNEAFFIFRNRNPVRPAHFRSTLKLAIKKAGLDNRLYNSHSFRAGRSVDLLNMGVPIDVIKNLGRWSSKSNAVYRYLKFHNL